MSFFSKRIKNAASIQNSDMDNIGMCFINVLPSTYLANLDISVIANYFGQSNLANLFQPDDPSITVLTAKIE